MGAGVMPPFGMSKFESILEDFSNALKRFEEILSEDETDIVRDSAIKRFELFFDLAWKTIKAFLEERHNIPCVSPRNCLREAFRVGLISYDDYWITLADDRNYTVHAYSEALADKIYKDLPRALEFFKQLSTALQK